MGKFKCQALVLLVPADFQVPRPARVTLFPALSGSRIFCSCPAGVWLERQARVRLLSGWTFSYGKRSQHYATLNRGRRGGCFNDLCHWFVYDLKESYIFEINYEIA